MPEESFMLISLKEKQSKKLAQTISNETCRAILDHLANKEFATETQISKELEMPLSTVHYNLKSLVESKLITADEYHYSGKGKEVPHYKLANKFIIIAPKNEKKVMDKIRRFFPIAAIAVGVAAVLEFGKRVFSSGASVMKSNLAAMDAAPRVMEESAGAMPQAMKVAADAAPEAVMATANATLNATPEAVHVAAEALPIMAQEAARTPFPSAFSVWFLGGALFALLVLAVWELVRKK